MSNTFILCVTKDTSRVPQNRFRKTVLEYSPGPDHFPEEATNPNVTDPRVVFSRCPMFFHSSSNRSPGLGKMYHDGVPHFSTDSGVFRSRFLMPTALCRNHECVCMGRVDA